MSRRRAVGCMAATPRPSAPRTGSDRRRGDDRLTGLRPSRADDRGRRDPSSPRLAQRVVGDRARRLRLAAPGPDGATRRPRNGGVGPARCQQTPRRPARLGGRPYTFMRRVLATDRGGELSPNAKACRAGLRRHQIQPPLRPLPTPRPIRRALKMATDHRDGSTCSRSTATDTPQRPPEPERCSTRGTGPDRTDRTPKWVAMSLRFRRAARGYPSQRPTPVALDAKRSENSHLCATPPRTTNANPLRTCRLLRSRAAHCAGTAAPGTARCGLRARTMVRP
jgi:hypothetical protein